VQRSRNSASGTAPGGRTGCCAAGAATASPKPPRNRSSPTNASAPAPIALAPAHKRLRSSRLGSTALLFLDHVLAVLLGQTDAPHDRAGSTRAHAQTTVVALLAE